MEGRPWTPYHSPLIITADEKARHSQRKGGPGGLRRAG